ncbi:P-loop containing nucleoside triphosphate hydrolase protein [Metschnikowia bicuspidata var. bicuspidata NRRL YB-4993]|uniref:p-loop containing nucleoside triphosphate hydrolase protein n=1 Tax=Metschnikowia bicuspidata var. bicuspidata NRRL YB-4993 TaxID=869754 RepID=A0A1A0H607_9ASCO|nr:P-loop containing nucleoside triphosphate hydrolase protein [Metschnikowia bicuspidata var. bicuspidata NRRL YB-4993]OBA19390.1 P-loop containing nucleoside triphosphate hydrolase protein [Metschnikowia bicuspidata var. bicuspidata NRRL YB-4993]
MSCPLWNYDDVPQCARTQVLFYAPLAIGGMSLAYLAVSSARFFTRKETPVALSEENRPLLANPDAYGAIGSNPDLKAPQLSLKDRHFDLSLLSNTNEDGTPHGQMKDVPKGLSDRIRVASEYCLVIFQLAITAATLFMSDFSEEWNLFPVSLALTAYWLYAFLLCSVRVINLSKVRVAGPSLWYHSTALYMLYFFPAAVFARSALAANVKSNLVCRYYEASFVATALLVFLNITTEIGDKPGQVYVTSDGAKPSPERISSLWAFSTYSWIDPMIWKAYKSPMVKEDIWGLREDDHALDVLKKFESTKLTARFTFKLFSHFKALFLLQGFWAILDSVLVFVPTLLLKSVLEYVSDQSSTTKNVAWCLVILMPLTKMADSVTSGFSLFLGRRVCVRMRAIIIGQVYSKALRRRIVTSEDSEETNNDSESKDGGAKKSDPKDSKSSELGAIINLMAIDAFKVSEICGYLHFFVGAILMLIFCIVLLYSLLGWSALIGGSVIILVLPFNYKFSAWVARAQKTMLSVTDKRIQKMNETFLSIRIIKFFAWEDNFFREIMNIRKEEMYYLKLRVFCWGCQSFVWFVIPTLVTVISFYCYTVIEGKPLTAPIAFTALSLFTFLRSPLDQLSDMTAIVIQSKVSLDRISDFLEEEESSKYEQLEQTPSVSSPLIGFENASFSWNSKSDKDFKLKDLNTAFLPGKLNVIIGPTGSGKTSLLLALLGEMELNAGKIFLPGIIPRDELVVDPRTGLTESVAYCSQGAWLLNDTIRNNITFASQFNQERYDKVVDACGLTRDFQILSAGDQTEIGEKGIALSGGQKQRVSLARALYSNSRHVLLDDCLSAVDSHTALWIYENCISGPLMANRTCILVSHNVALTVQKADWVVVMNNGRVDHEGTPEHLMSNGHLGDDELVRTSVMNSRSQSSTELQTLDSKNSDMKAKSQAIENKLQKLAEGDDEEVVRTDGKLVEDETKADGVVGLKVYTDYAKEFGGWFTWTCIVAIFLIPQGVFIAQSWWLKKWALETAESTVGIASLNNVNSFRELKSEFMSSVVSTTHVAFSYVRPQAIIETVQTFQKENSVLFYISIYGGIGMTYALLATLRVFWTFLAGITASNNVFQKVLTRILRAKLRFFDKTPLGRIMNRFSKDIEAVDQELTPFAEGVFAFVIACVSTLLLIAIITPGFLFFAVFIAYFYYLVGVFYISLSRELKRFDSITKSPIHQHFSESLVGVATIRAYGVETRFMKQNLSAIDNNNRPFFYMWVANRWLSIRIDAVGSMVMFFSGVFVLLSIGRIDAGLAGLSLSYAISFSENALWIVRLYANIEMNMNSVERLQEYLDVEEEPPAEVPETKPASNWPQTGEIDVNDLSLRYAPDLPRVIKNATFHVKPCHKIGIVGRTGAGKSTIITAFFRFLDAETGSIKIDGVDISKIGLKDLRSAITIIPQDPTLFTGTIRSNLDPFNQYSDEQIFEALTRVNLIGKKEREREVSKDDANENQNKFMDIESSVSEGGNNLSQGQRQLMCLARSLLKSPKVILLDEATASIDYKSDALIQQTIRDEFSHSTILTIAHRLRSIIDYDKILVMDAGRVVEYDDPYALIANKDSLFYSMCENSGELDSLTKLAKASFVNKKNAIRN